MKMRGRGGREGERDEDEREGGEEGERDEDEREGRERGRER